VEQEVESEGRPDHCRQKEWTNEWELQMARLSDGWRLGLQAMDYARQIRFLNNTI
jgi:hypothetical protein